MLNASQRRVNKNSLTWWYVLKTSWRCLEDVFQDVLKTFWRSLADVLKTSSKRLEVVLKMSWRRLCKTSWRPLENVLKMSWRRIVKTNILVLTKTSSEDVSLRRTYSSWSRRLEERRKTSWGRLQDVFIKTNVCWVNVFRSHYNVTEIFIFTYSFMRMKFSFGYDRIKVIQTIKITKTNH